MIQFGMPTMIETESLARCVQVCRELGLDFVELNLNFPQFQLHKLDPDELNRLSSAYGIFYTIHLDDEMNIADFNPYVASAYLQTTLDAVALAKKIGAKKLNMHLSRGAKCTLPAKVILFFEAYTEDYLRNIAAFRDACEAAIGDSDIRICVENTNGFLPFQRDALEVLLQSPAFGLTLDIGHNYCAGNADEEWILTRADRLHHFHIHDAKDGKKDHLALGKGEIDVKRYLSMAEKLDCTVVLETKTIEGLSASVKWKNEHI